MESSQTLENQSNNAVKGNSIPMEKEMRNKEGYWNHKESEPQTESQHKENAPIVTKNLNTKMAITNTRKTTLEQSVFKEGGASVSFAPSKEAMDSGCPSPFLLNSGDPGHSKENHQTIITSNKEASLAQQLDEELSDYFEEQYEYEYDDLLVDELPEISQPIFLPSTTLNANNTIMLSEDPTFFEKDLEDFINNDELDGTGGQLISESTFHSIQNSMNSSSSFVNGMGKLIVHQPDKSTSNSSKRKITENVEDTATSEKRAGKKTKY